MKKIINIFLIFIVIFLSGCWDMREINELGHVVAVGIDKAEDSNDYIITVQIPNPKPSNGGTQTEKSSSGEAFYVVTAQGKTLFDATRDLSKTTAKRIMWAHNNIVIIGESLAKDDITPVVDYFTHNPELRMKTLIVVAKGKAQDYLGLKSGMEDVPGSAFANIYGHSSLTAEFIKTDLLKFSQSFYGENSQPLISMISFEKSKIIPSDKETEEPENEVSFGGAAIFIKNKMVGQLTPEETKGLAWIMNETHQTTVSVEESWQPDKYVTLEIHNPKAGYMAKIEDGKPFIEIKIETEASIVEEDGTKNLSIGEYKDELEGLVAEKIVKDINAALIKIQKEYKSDVLGFANKFYRQHNKEWKSKLKENWKNIYPEMPVNIKVKVDIMSSALFQQPNKIIEKE